MKIYKKITISSIIIMTIAIFSVLIVLFGNKIKTKIQNEEKEALNPDEIIDMLTYIPYSNIKFEKYQNAYQGEKVINNDIISMILSNIFIDRKVEGYTKETIEDENIKKKIEENNIQGPIFLNSTVENYLMKRYNIELDSIDNKSNEIDIIKLNDMYTTFAFKNASKFEMIYKIFLSVEEAYTTPSNAIITEKTLFYTLKDDIYYVYKNTDISKEENIIKTYNKIDENGKELGYDDIFNKIKEDFKDYKGTFKHTFKKNDTGYYWYSTEFVE